MVNKLMHQTSKDKNMYIIYIYVPEMSTKLKDKQLNNKANSHISTNRGIIRIRNTPNRKHQQQ